jgi:hypothetical protein
MCSSTLDSEIGVNLIGIRRPIRASICGRHKKKRRVGFGAFDLDRKGARQVKTIPKRHRNGPASLLESGGSEIIPSNTALSGAQG